MIRRILESLSIIDPGAQFTRGELAALAWIGACMAVMVAAGVAARW